MQSLRLNLKEINVIFIIQTKNKATKPLSAKAIDLQATKIQF